VLTSVLLERIEIKCQAGMTMIYKDTLDASSKNFLAITEEPIADSSLIHRLLF
jgi:hypothetical protein